VIVTNTKYYVGLCNNSSHVDPRIEEFTNYNQAREFFLAHLYHSADCGTDASAAVLYKEVEYSNRRQLHVYALDGWSNEIEEEMGGKLLFDFEKRAFNKGLSYSHAVRCS